MKEYRLFSRITSVFLGLMLTVFLFAFGSGGFQTILSVKYRLFLILCGGYCGVMLLLLMESAVVGAVKLPRPGELLRRSSWPQRLMLIYLLFSLAATVCSPFGSRAWLGASRHEGFLTILIYCLTFLLVSVFGKAERWMLWVMAAGVTLLSVLCIIQLFGGNPFGLYPEGMTYLDAGVKYSGAYLGTIGNVDSVAAFLCVVIPILWIALIRLKGKLRFLLLIPLAAALFVLCRMSVMAGLVGVFGGGLLSLPVVLPLSGKGRKLLASAIGVVILLALVGVYLFDMGGGLLHEMHEMLRGRVEDSFGSGRIHIWKETLEFIVRRPLLGYGPDTMILAGLKPFTRWHEGLGITLTAAIDTAHNEYLNIWFHQGLFALLSFLSALICAAVRWAKKSREDGVTALLGGAILCFCVQAFFGIGTCITSPYFWIAFGLLGQNKNSRAR